MHRLSPLLLLLAGAAIAAEPGAIGSAGELAAFLRDGEPGVRAFSVTGRVSFAEADAFVLSDGGARVYVGLDGPSPPRGALVRAEGTAGVPRGDPAVPFLMRGEPYADARAVEVLSRDEPPPPERIALAAIDPNRDDLAFLATAGEVSDAGPDEMDERYAVLVLADGERTLPVFVPARPGFDAGALVGARVEAEGLFKTYKGRTVVRGVTIRVDKGEVVGLLGPNGAGKTTSFYMILGLVRPDKGRGRILFNGTDVTRYPVYRRARAGLGYLAQEPSIFRKLTVEQNIWAILETTDLPHADRRRRLDELLERFDLAKVRKQWAYTLSGGERRKLEIARSLVQNPSVLMLDEPFAGVDPVAVEGIRSIVGDLKSDGIGILITDHNVRETLSIVDRAYILIDGTVIKEGSPDDIIADRVVRERYLTEDFHM